MVDIATLFFVSDGALSYRDIRGSSAGLREYAQFADIEGAATDDDNLYTSRLTLRSTINQMEANRTTTLDAFLRGDIGMIVGYPGLVGELEKSQKRAGVDGVTDLVYTERLPRFSSRDDWNIARYSYFGISRLSESPDASLRFLEYLMSPEAQRIALKIYPHWIPAQGEFLASRQ